MNWIPFHTKKQPQGLQIYGWETITRHAVPLRDSTLFGMGFYRATVCTKKSGQRAISLVNTLLREMVLETRRTTHYFS